MVTLGEYAKEHIQTTATKNIAELPEVLVGMEIVEDSFEFEKDGETKTVNQQVVVIDNVKYRVPTSVINQLQIHLDDNPTMKKFKVRSSGSGMDTRYTIIPLMA